MSVGSCDGDVCDLLLRLLLGSWSRLGEDERVVFGTRCDQTVYAAQDDGIDAPAAEGLPGVQGRGVGSEVLEPGRPFNVGDAEVEVEHVQRGRLEVPEAVLGDVGHVVPTREG